MNVFFLLTLLCFGVWAPFGFADEAPPPAPPVITGGEGDVEPAAVEAETPAISAGDEPLQDPSEVPQSTTVSVWKESADDLDEVTLSVSAGYDVVVEGPQIEGTGAFHLVHPEGLSTESITLDPSFLVEADSKLFFESRLGTATSDQVAEVWISDNDGASWSLLWSQPGEGQPGQTAFQRREIDLSARAGDTVRLRFQYRFSGGSYYSGTSLSLGWLIDDIQVGDTYVIDPTPYSIGDPTDLEQQNLEFINRARASASAEAIRLRDSDDPDVVSAMNFFEVDKVLLVQQFGDLTETAPPLVLNAKLTAAARLHSQDMLNNEFQGHTSSNNPPPPNEAGDSMGMRLSRQGYDFSTAGENVFAYAESNWHAHAGFNIDWGSGANGSIGGMQDPPGHRLSIHNPDFREIGIGILEGSQGSVGPMLVTQNFGVSQSMDTPFITGVAWEDLNGNGEYDPGEGLSGLEVTVEGERFMAATSGSGGFGVPVFADGTYTVHFQAEGHPDWTTSVEVSGGQNVKVDYRRDTVPFDPVIAPLAGDGSSSEGFTLSVTEAYRVPVLQYSDDLSLEDWQDLPEMDPEDLGGQEYRFTLPAAPEGSRFYRLVFP